MQILSIGNNFSQDAQRYLHQIVDADGEALKCVNLMIGGCPLYFPTFGITQKKDDDFKFSIHEGEANQEPSHPFLLDLEIGYHVGTIEKIADTLGAESVVVR